MTINSFTKLQIKRRQFARRVAKICSRYNPNNLAWGLVIIGGIVECFWVSGLKHAESLPLLALTVLGIAFSFLAMVLAVKVLEISVAYSVFVGIGTVGVVISEVAVFGEAFSPIKIALIAILLCCVIALKAVSKSDEAHKDISLVENLSSDLGLDSALDSAFEKLESQKFGGAK